MSIYGVTQDLGADWRDRVGCATWDPAEATYSSSLGLMQYSHATLVELDRPLDRMKIIRAD
jgi:hypothetical protein